MESNLESIPSAKQHRAPRTALVTGASRGLGAAIAVELASRGVSVAVNYFERRERGDQVCQSIREQGGIAEAFQADVRDEGQSARMVKVIQEWAGQIDIVVFNATGPQPFLSIDEQTWQAHLQQLEYFVKSPLILTKLLIPGMKERRYGRIVHIGSEVVELGNPRFAHYVAAKSAQLGLTRSWARELADTGITVNLVAPGWIPTERHLDSTEGEINAYREGVPMKHMGMPRDVANAVAFLAGEDASFITGQKISVNGGNTLE
jgi:3-oxoacyl-[acyl-carrier protein] reductase